MTSQMPISSGVDLPPFTVRISPRAKRLLLKVSPLGRVEVVAPCRVKPAEVQVFVQRHHHWLRRTLAKLAVERGRYHSNDVGLPSQMELRALDECWQLDIAQNPINPAGRSLVVASEGKVMIRVSDHDAAVRALRTWLQARAKQRLAAWLREVSVETGLPFRSSSVRVQKSRWGSCSHLGAISLNRNLLFLPPHLVRHVMLHELCHTVHLNHSGRYWKLVRRHEPLYEAHERELRRGDRYIPAWAFPD
ncbi:MAG: SprT family zinc-dependent metalloprotease [Pseudomonadota bacterium]